MKIILFFIIILCFQSCKKDKKTVACPEQNYFPLSNIAKQFNFKKNSYWIMKKNISSIKDTLKTYYATGTTISISNGVSMECNVGDKYEGYTQSLYHSMLPIGVQSIDLIGGYSGVNTEYYKYCGCNQLSLFEKNIGDSVMFNNNTNWSKIENIYPSIIINGNTYNNVYQMYYYPDLYGFKRIWWCPSIGFLKFEYFNTITSLSEFWELDTYNVQLY